MAEIIPHGSRRPGEIRESGSSGLFETMIASQREGCNRMSVRVLSLRSGGHTTMQDLACETVYLVQEGSLLLVDGDGFIHSLSPGDWAIVHPHEKHVLRNDSERETRVATVRSV
jgi:glyoxylate utilization-related uncharacterized protein